MEDTPGVVILPRSRFPHVFEQFALWNRGETFGLAGYPRASAGELEQGGMTVTDEPVPAMVYVPPKRFHAEWDDACLDMDSGGMCTRDHLMVLEGSQRTRKPDRLKAIWLYGRRKPVKPLQQPGLCAALASKWAGRNYYHWLIDCLANLARLVEIAGGRPLTLLVPKALPEQWNAPLEFLLPDHFTLRRASGWVQAERCLMPSPGHLRPAAWLPEKELNFLRENVFRHYGLDPEPSGDRRIFISRAGAGSRRLVNEAELEAMLKPLGFETVQLETLTFEQQVRLFHGAAIVAGVHGAGFANLIFAGRTRVLELFPRGNFKPMYFFLSTCLRQDYRFLHGGSPSLATDFFVDAPRLRDEIETLL